MQKFNKIDAAEMKYLKSNKKMPCNLQGIFYFYVFYLIFSLSFGGPEASGGKIKTTQLCIDSIENVS
jgi:hypothetical protein